MIFCTVAIDSVAVSLYTRIRLHRARNATDVDKETFCAHAFANNAMLRTTYLWEATGRRLL